MSSIRRVDVGEAGLRYASDVMAADGGLSKALRREWSRFTRASALLPFDLAPQLAANFLTGGVFPGGDGLDSAEGARSSDASLATMIDAFLRGSPTHLAIFEDFNLVSVQIRYKVAAPIRDGHPESGQFGPAAENLLLSHHYRGPGEGHGASYEGTAHHCWILSPMSSPRARHRSGL